MEHIVLLNTEINDIEAQVSEKYKYEDTNHLIINIKTLVSDSTIILHVSNDITIYTLKELISDKINTKDKTIRLIHHGKLLGNNSQKLKDTDIKTNDFIHCALSPAIKKPVTTPEIDISSSPAVHIEIPISSGRGFDILRSRLSAEEVQALRLYFYPQISPLIQQSPLRPGETTDERIYRVEEEWMARQGPRSEFALNTSLLNTNQNDRTTHSNESDIILMNQERDGNTSDFLWGFSLGLLLGFILLFWLWERSIPNKQKIGILLGVMINMTFSAFPKSIFS